MAGRRTFRILTCSQQSGRNRERMEFTVYFSTLRSEIGSPSDTLGPIYQITGRHIMDDSNLYWLFIYQRPFISVQVM